MHVNLTHDRPCWRYRLKEDGSCEKKLFNTPELVPAGEGWVDTPALLPGGDQYEDHQRKLKEARGERDSAKAELAELQKEAAAPDEAQTEPKKTGKLTKSEQRRLRGRPASTPDDGAL